MPRRVLDGERDVEPSGKCNEPEAIADRHREAHNEPDEHDGGKLAQHRKPAQAHNRQQSQATLCPRDHRKVTFDDGKAGHGRSGS